MQVRFLQSHAESIISRNFKNATIPKIDVHGTWISERICFLRKTEVILLKYQSLFMKTVDDKKQYVIDKQ